MPCTYTVNANESQKDANVRSRQHLQLAHDKYARLFDLLIGESNDRATSLFQRLRSGEPFESLLSVPTTSASSIVSLEQQARQDAIMLLTQSTASLRSVAQLSKNLLVDNMRIALPPHDVFESLKNHIIDEPALENIFGEICQTGSDRALLAQTARSVHTSMPELLPTYEILASPWTGLLGNSFLFSELISLFLEVINPLWSMVDKVTFLAALRTCDADDTFCSRLLVYAVLSCASVGTVLQRLNNDN